MMKLAFDSFPIFFHFFLLRSNKGINQAKNFNWGLVLTNNLIYIRRRIRIKN